MTTAITEYSKTEAALADLAQRYKDVVFDVTTKDGMGAAIKGRAELRTYRVDLERTRVALKAPALERSRLIDAEAKRITAELILLEDPIDELIKREEQRKEREKAEREAKEAARLLHIQNCITEIVSTPGTMVGRTSTQIGVKLADMRNMDVTPWAAEFEPQAEAAKNNAILALEQLRDGAKAQEDAKAAEEKRMADERAELERLRDEQAKRVSAEHARMEQERRARDEEDRKRAIAEAEARAKIEAEQKASREKIEAEEAAAKAKRDEDDRIARESREAVERKAAAERLKLEAEQARIDAANRAADAERAAAQRAEQERLQAESDRLAAAQRELDRQQQELLDGEGMLRLFVTKFSKRREFAAVVKAIHAHFEKVKA